MFGARKWHVTQEFEAASPSCSLHQDPALEMISTPFLSSVKRYGRRVPGRKKAVRFIWGLCQQWTQVIRVLFCRRPEVGLTSTSSALKQPLWASQHANCVKNVIYDKDLLTRLPMPMALSATAESKCRPADKRPRNSIMSAQRANGPSAHSRDSHTDSARSPLP